MSGLPVTENSYSLSIHATHGGGPDNEDFSIYFHVGFWYLREGKDEKDRNICYRKLRHIRRFFQGLVESEMLDDGGDDGQISAIHDKYFCDMLYSRVFTRKDNPVLCEAMMPAVERFKELSASPELCLFLCHASEDKPFVDRLAAYLDRQGMELWYDKREIKIGESIVGRINEGLELASHVVVVLSKTSVDKPWVKKEMSAALMKQLQDRSITVIPLLREDCRIPPLLADIKYADCRKEQETEFRHMIDDMTGG